MKLNELNIMEALPKIGKGLRNYVEIQNIFQQCDVRSDWEFQRKYNAFYRVRRGSKWRRKYFDLMEKSKTAEINFSEALYAMKEGTGRIEASFVSKLIATIDPNKPVIDRHVLKNFCLRLPYYSAKNRENKIIQIYNELSKKYDSILRSEIGFFLIDEFLKMYPWAEITDLKKIDLVLWQIR